MDSTSNTTDRFQNNDFCDFNEKEFLNNYVQLVHSQEVVITGLSLDPTAQYLACCTQSGDLALFSIEAALNSQDLSKVECKPSSFTFNGQSGCLNCLETVEIGSQPFLFSGGDGCIVTWRWEDLVNRTNTTPYIKYSIPQTISNSGLVMPVAECNSFCFDKQTNSIFAATGDNNAYMWDLETQQIKQKFGGNSDYLHCIQYISKTNQLAAGSEDGKLSIWDVRNGQISSMIDVKEQIIENCGIKNSDVKHAWIGSLLVEENGNFLICGGGCENEKGRFSKGWVSYWHAASMTMTSGVSLRANPQVMMITNENQLLVGGNERSVRVLDLASLTVLSSIQVQPLSIFALIPLSNICQQGFCVAGTSQAIDFHLYPSHRTFSLGFTSSTPNK